MEELILTPILIALLLGIAADLEDLAFQATDRTVQFADDATAALDCAYEARPLTECAPNIMSADFSEEIEQLKQINDQTSLVYDQLEGQ